MLVKVCICSGSVNSESPYRVSVLELRRSIFPTLSKAARPGCSPNPDVTLIDKIGFGGALAARGDFRRGCPLWRRRAGSQSVEANEHLCQNDSRLPDRPLPTDHITPFFPLPPDRSPPFSSIPPADRRHDAAQRLCAVAAATPSRATARLDGTAAAVSPAAARLRSVTAGLCRRQPVPAAGGQQWECVWRVRAVHERSHGAGGGAVWADRLQARAGIRGAERTDNEQPRPRN